MSASPRIKFRCSHCDKLLSIGRKKAGAEVACPQCQTKITVPPDDQPAPATDSPDNLFSEFQVYDDEYDEPELIYEDNPATDSAASGTLNERLSVSRRVIYWQGALLGIVAVLFFLLGLLIGSSSQPRSGTADDISVVSGTIVLEDSIGDEGAVVFLLPTESRPDARFEAEELRPGRVFTSANPEVPLIRGFGGNVCTANRAGQFEMKVTSNREYVLLVVSANATRGGELDSDFHTELGHYFSSLDNLTEGRACFYKKVLPLRSRENFGEIKLDSNG